MNADTIRAGGITTVAVDKPTKAMLKQLAGDTPLYVYVKQLAIKEMVGGQAGLPGHEHLTSQHTIAAVKSDTAAIRAFVKRLDAAFDKAVPPYDWNKDAIVQLARFIAKEAQQVAEVQPSMFNEKEAA